MSVARRAAALVVARGFSGVEQSRVVLRANRDVIAQSVRDVSHDELRLQDPVVTDGDQYETLLESEQVRVLEYRDKPDRGTHQHPHPAFVLY